MRFNERYTSRSCIVSGAAKQKSGHNVVNGWNHADRDMIFWVTLLPTEYGQCAAAGNTHERNGADERNGGKPYRGSATHSSAAPLPHEVPGEPKGEPGGFMLCIVLL